MLRHEDVRYQRLILEAGSNAVTVRFHPPLTGFAGPGGRVEILGHYGLTRDTVRRRGRLTSIDVTSASQSDSLVRALADEDQGHLWASAERILTADEALRSEAEALGAAPEDAPVVEEIERRHREFEAA